MTKCFLLSSLIIAISMSSLAQVKSDTLNLDNNQEAISDSVLKAQISFKFESFDLGTVSDDTVIQRVFTFKNIGNDTLTILSAKADCSCTVPDFSAGKFAPGDSGDIKVSFYGKDNSGRFIQYITVLHNSGEGYSFLSLKGFVERKL